MPFELEVVRIEVEYRFLELSYGEEYTSLDLKEAH